MKGIEEMMHSGALSEGSGQGVSKKDNKQRQQCGDFQSPLALDS